MGRRSKADAALDRDEVKRMINSLPRDLSSGSALEKAVWLVENSCQVTAVADVVECSKSSLRRALAAKRSGREFGQNGRPTYLTSEQENRLEEWIRRENQEGHGPRISAVCEKVRRLYQCVRRVMNTFLTAIWYVGSRDGAKSLERVGPSFPN